MSACKSTTSTTNPLSLAERLNLGEKAVPGPPRMELILSRNLPRQTTGKRVRHGATACVFKSISGPYH
jgi:hypothetical protein